MTFSPRLAGVFAAAFMLLAPALAHASDVNCLWNALPRPTQDAFNAKYDAGDPTGGLQLIMDDTNALGQVVVKCSISGTSGQAAGKALAGFAVRQAAARTIQKTFGVAEPRLFSAWAAQTPASRKAFEDAIPTGNLDDRFVDNIAKSLGITTDEGFYQLRYWLVSNVMVQQMDGQY